MDLAVSVCYVELKIAPYDVIWLFQFTQRINPQRCGSPHPL